MQDIRYGLQLLGVHVGNRSVCQLANEPVERAVCVVDHRPIKHKVLPLVFQLGTKLSKCLCALGLCHAISERHVKLLPFFTFCEAVPATHVDSGQHSVHSTSEVFRYMVLVVGVLILCQQTLCVRCYLTAERLSPARLSAFGLLLLELTLLSGKLAVPSGPLLEGLTLLLFESLLILELGALQTLVRTFPLFCALLLELTLLPRKVAVALCVCLERLALLLFDGLFILELETLHAVVLSGLGLVLLDRRRCDVGVETFQTPTKIVDWFETLTRSNDFAVVINSNRVSRLDTSSVKVNVHIRRTKPFCVASVVSDVFESHAVVTMIMRRFRYLPCGYTPIKMQLLSDILRYLYVVPVGVVAVNNKLLSGATIELVYSGLTMWLRI